MQHSATYSPEDNKLRLYPAHRLDAETYAKVKGAGFSWAPKQQIFVAGMWTPSREDLLTELCGEIGDEDKTLAERAEERADRFDDYQDKRRADATAAYDASGQIADRFTMGQPILVGHHSEKRARKDKERIDGHMRRAVKMWDTAEYWQRRAAGALAHAKYKELPAVRARRIKTIEADRRKVERSKKENATKRALWLTCSTIEQARHISNYTQFNCTEEGRSHGGSWSAWDVLRPDGDRYQGCPSWTLEQVKARALEVYRAETPKADRWLAHYDNRLAYEKAMLDEQGGTALLAPKPRRELLPLLNYRAPGAAITADNKWNRGTTITYRQVDMTKAEYAKIYTDYKGTRHGPDNQHRFRTAMIRHELVCVFLTDSKEHSAPTSTTPKPTPPPAPRPLPPITPREPTPQHAQAGLFENLRAAVKAGGVEVVAAPQLFPTPHALAAQMIEKADIHDTHRVLEPSAGTGNLLGAARLAYNSRNAEYVAVELNQRLADTLRASFPTADVRAADFLECNGDLGTFDRIVMNPPFQNGSDIKHIEHARKMLRPGGRLVAICANGPRQRDALQGIASQWRDLPEGTFKEAGTMVNTALIVIDA